MTTFGDLADVLPSDEEDEDDEEYVPNEEASSGEEVTSEEEEEEETAFNSTSKSKQPAKRKANNNKVRKSGITPRKRRRGCFEVSKESELDVEEIGESEEKAKEVNDTNKESEESADTSRSDSLWKNFLQRSSRPLKRDDEVTKTKVERVYDFAGETVRVTQEVDVNSKAKKSALSESLFPKAAEPATGEAVKTATPTPSLSVAPKPSSASSLPSSARDANKNGKPGSGVSSLLERLQSKKKISVLEKSRLDWTSFTTSEGITEELQIHNRGKDGYLEKMAFLERTDYRQFEKERDLRLGIKRSKR